MTDSKTRDYVTFEEMEGLLSEIERNAYNSFVVIDGERYNTDWGYGIEGIVYFIDMLKRRKERSHDR